MSNGNFAAALLATVCAAASAATADGIRISGPFTHENLSVYLLHTTGKRDATNLLTLNEAMEQKKTAVYETGNVQQLAIENLSSQPVFVQAGDIVKGGKQDRVLTTDFVLPPRSGRVPIASFCVEQGRWTKRGPEPADQFHATTAAVPTRALKLAVREPGNQAAVWQNVAEARERLSIVAGVGAGQGGRGATVSAPQTFIAPGATSMQIALEDRKVTEAIDRYIAALSKVIDGKGDTVGYAYTVNGRFSGADVYSSPDLFRRIWPKLLHSSAAEALADRAKTSAAKPLDTAVISKAIADADGGRAAAPRKNGSVFVTKRDSDQSVLYVTTDREVEGPWLHKSYIAR